MPYRVVPNGSGSELMMTYQQTANVSDDEYRHQLQWMKDELERVQTIMEENRRTKNRNG